MDVKGTGRKVHARKRDRKVLKRKEKTGMQIKKGWKRTGKHNKEGKE